MLFRDARPDELDEVGELTAEAYGDLVSERYALVLRDARTRARDAQIIVCIDAGQLAGAATFVAHGGPWSEIAQADEAEFRMLAVDAGARGRGIGAALVEHMLGLSAHLGRQRLVCSSANDMTAAHRLYERLGFTRAPERDWSPVDGVTLRVFARDLTAHGSAPFVPS